MKARLAVAGGCVGMLVLAVFSHLTSQPSFNGNAPRCSGGGCHTFQAGKISVVPQGGLTVQVTLSGITADVAGELVDSTGTVVTSVDKSSNNPFTLTAPYSGTFTVNAGYKDPQRQWDSARVTLTLTGIDGSADETPGGTFSLNQNYPNPFNPSTVISFTLPTAGYTTLAVYTSLGEEVAQIVREDMAAGYHAVTFQNPGLATGVYLYRLQSGKYTAARKLIVLK